MKMDSRAQRLFRFFLYFRRVHPHTHTRALINIVLSVVEMVAVVA